MKESTWGFDDAVLVRLGGVAMALAVGQTLHHFHLTFELARRLWISGSRTQRRGVCSERKQGGEEERV